MKLVIVDDIAINRKLLRVALEAEGHATLEAGDGVEALQLLSSEKVDGVVSDILMPRMDGYRLCHEIRTDDRLCDLPVVIYTATYLSPSDERLALDMGADKYLKKPSPVATVLAALSEAIAMQHTAPRPDALQQVEVLKDYSDRLVAKLEERNIELEERLRQLAGANERLNILDHAKNEFLNLISHELRTPLNGVLGISRMVLGELPPGKLKAEFEQAFEKSKRRILAILDDSVLLTQIDVSGEQFSSGPVSLQTVLSRAREGAKDFAKFRRVTLAPPTAARDLVVGEEDLLVRAFEALLDTAIKFSGEGEAVHLAQEPCPGGVGVTIESHGKTIPPPALPIFFDLFSIAESSTPGGDLGLGPAMAYRILALFGGSVSVVNREPSGIRLTVSLRDAASV
ncbi:MAG TPA: hybrid sensor histidine kinase/response regulator [Bryobacteraceae bacterium]|nr:hybrid sensor histidine kinase/response regulator [Bryobacteraceae bacterium]